ncbi:MAG TPA: ActS/PrrB/RegB family redox-sensitive histidine kinase [Aestuariivirgaceae bacterium]|nr:ActS/PrrB/RegB family redox-sensitive histidine kinase [Aestuariivirgaceae bacterium]
MDETALPPRRVGPAARTVRRTHRLGRSLEGVRLQTLVRLRWLAVGGQTAAVLFVYGVLGFPLPLGLCLAAIALSAWLNVFLSLRWRSSLRLHDRYAALLLGYDILQLAALLYLTGGLENPFSFLFLVPVTVSATTLPLNRTIVLGILTLAAVTFLAFWRMPLPWVPGAPLELPGIYIAGMWTALVSGLVFSAVYVNRIAREARQMSDALTATEIIHAREQQLSALDGLAAAAAHELGTPLATIALVAKELKRELAGDRQVGEDLDLLISQTARCREILSRLADREAQRDEMFASLKLTVMIEEIVAPLRGGDIRFAVDARPFETGGEGAGEPKIWRNPAIKYGLSNIIGNASDFARSRVDIEARWSPGEVAVSITDDGPGFSQEVIDRLGEPYVTTRQGYGPGSDQPASQSEGMGLGFFIANRLLERSGATVTLDNRPTPDHGAQVHVTWPRAALEASDPR